MQLYALHIKMIETHTQVYLSSKHTIPVSEFLN